MKIFLALKVPRGDAERETLIDELSASAIETGDVIFVAPREIARAGLTAPQDFMPFVRERLTDAELFILIYHSELRGGLIEAGIAYERRIPIWVCHKANEKVSSSLLGCADAVMEYNDADDLGEKVLAKLKKLPKS